jgi:hypothetical protein
MPPSPPPFLLLCVRCTCIQSLQGRTHVHFVYHTLFGRGDTPLVAKLQDKFYQEQAGRSKGKMGMKRGSVWKLQFS